MRNVAAIPAAGLLAGAAFGLLLPDLPHALAYSCLIACAALALWAWRIARGRLLAAAAALAFAVGGALLSADAWQRAWRPPLRAVFDELAHRQRAQAALANAKATQTRAHDLFDRGIAARKDTEDADRAIADAQAAVAQAEASRGAANLTGLCLCCHNEASSRFSTGRRSDAIGPTERTAHRRD